MPVSSGSIEGDLTVVPRRLSKLDGPEFRVWVTLFALKIPKYIFCVLIQRILIFYGKGTEVDDPEVYYKCMHFAIGVINEDNNFFIYLVLWDN